MFPAIGLVLVSSTFAVGAQPAVSDIPLESRVITLQQKDHEAILLRITNASPEASLVCVRAVSYQVGDGGRGEMMPHRCHVEANFVLVLPGESYFYRVAEADDTPSDAELVVDATVVVRPPSAFEATSERQHRLRWEGTVQRARDGFRALSGGR